MELLKQQIKDNGSSVIVFTCSTSNSVLQDILRDDFNFELCLRKLSLSEQQAVRNSKYNQVKALVLRLFAKYCLNSSIQLVENAPQFIPWAELNYTCNEYGKPLLTGGNGHMLQFNSSSSNDLAAVVVQFNLKTPIGIDLSHEVQDSISPWNFMDQFEGIFSTQETLYLESISDLRSRYFAFNQLWTLKEAFTKFLGTGLNIDLSSFSFTGLGAFHGPFQYDDSTSLQENELLWDNKIRVDTSRLPSDLLSGLTNSSIYCLSAILKKPSIDVLKTNGPSTLPVYISLVHQLESPYVQCVTIDMVSLIQNIIDDCSQEAV